MNRKTLYGGTIAGTVAAAVAVTTLGVAPIAGAASTGAATQGAGSTSATADAAGDVSATAVSTVKWTTCKDAGLKSAGAQCGTVTVPLDYSRPGGTKIKIAISRVKHTVANSKYQGVMLVNPGGPGGSGLGLSTIGSYVPNKAGDAYDWIGFDPRGVGASAPSVSCDADYAKGPRPAYEPTTVSIENAWLRKSRAYAKACAAKYGKLLPYLKTTDSARDMDAIRIALGQRKINYYGFSYGTYLGQVYATMYPNRVRRMVLDSNVDPTRVWYKANIDQDYAFDRNIKIWFTWLAKYNSVYHLGSTGAAVEKAWYAEKAKLAKKPAGGVVGSAEWTDIFLQAGYYQQTWLDLADLWSTWNASHSNAKPLITAYDAAGSPTDDNSFAMYLGVQCADTTWPRDWSVWHRDTVKVNRTAPFIAWSNAWFNAPCAFWSYKGSTPINVNGSKVAPILLLGETLDAATPFSGSLEVRKRFPNARLIAMPGGTSHAVSLFGNTCLDGKIAAYLAKGTLPARVKGNKPDTTCSPLPVPTPTTSTSSSSGSGSGTSRSALISALVHAQTPLG